MYRGLPGAEEANLPMARKISNEVICLPLYPGLKECDLERVVSIIAMG